MVSLCQIKHTILRLTWFEALETDSSLRVIFMAQICDFGLARGVDLAEEYALTEYVVTRWYRAPEVLAFLYLFDWISLSFICTYNVVVSNIYICECSS